MYPLDHKGNIRLENLCLNQIFCSKITKLQTTARERHIVSERGVHASRVSVGYYNIPRWSLKYYVINKVFFICISIIIFLYVSICNKKLKCTVIVIT
jgi:hypothetical protein